MAVFAARIGHFPRSSAGLFNAGNDLAPDRTVLIGGIDQIKKIRCNPQSEFAVSQLRACVFLRAEAGHEPMKLLQATYPMLHLPMPILPVRLRHSVPEPTPCRMKFFKLRKHCCCGSASALPR